MKNGKFKVITLGCRTNQYESQAYKSQLDKLGYMESSDECDIAIVNTCTVTSSADQKSLYQIRKVAQENPNAKIIVTGCMAKKKSSELMAMRGVDSVVFNDQKESLVNQAFPELEVEPFKIDQYSDKTRAFVKIQDGCNSYCSYCVIPFVRGRSRSRRKDEIISEIRGLVENGYKEVVLTGINIGDFDGGDGSCRLHDLVLEVDKIDGLDRIRISSIDPDEVDDDLLNAVIKGKKTCPSMHIVLQAGSNAVLSRMRRKYTKSDFFSAVERLKEARGDFTFTTDVIVGFPGESDFDFEETKSVVKEIGFVKVHVFPYSKREGTRASRFSDETQRSVILKRRSDLIRLSERVSFEKRQALLGQRHKVLFEGRDTHRIGYMKGSTENFLMVSVPSKGVARNEIHEVLLTKNLETGFVGEIV
jgi:threonylcarbamoyladenosine tRNA methylthiotransferase MtaB